MIAEWHKTPRSCCHTTTRFIFIKPYPTGVLHKLLKVTENKRKIKFSVTHTLLYGKRGLFALQYRVVCIAI